MVRLQQIFIKIFLLDIFADKLWSTDLKGEPSTGHSLPVSHISQSFDTDENYSQVLSNNSHLTDIIDYSQKSDLCNFSDTVSQQASSFNPFVPGGASAARHYVPGEFGLNVL